MDPTSITKTAPPPRSAPEIGADDLRLVLFGLPAAGKTSLLGALGQASESQEHLLGGKLDDEGGGLMEMRRQLYETAGKRTPQEVVPYPVRFSPLHSPPLDAVVMDCDGRVASEMMAKERTAGTAPGVSLAGEVADADALLLVTDASAPPDRLDKDFVEFDRFLDEMEKARGERTEVGGMPVFLVLTKCDLLAQQNDSAADWMDRIEQKKADADAKFRDFMANRQQGKEAAPGFGRLDIRVWATAVKRPPLLGTPAKPREPFGVAELFKQALGGASSYRASADRSDRRLSWLIGTSAVLVVGAILFALVFLSMSPSVETDRLTRDAESLRFADKATATERLRGTVEEVRRRLAKIAAVRDHAAFDSLPQELRQFVRERYTELSRYIAWYDKLLRDVKRPASVRSEEELETIRERLKGELLAPEEGWDDTPGGRLRRELLETTEAVSKAVRAVRNWHLDASDQAGKLLAFTDFKMDGLNFAGWAGEAERVVDPARKPPFSPEDTLPGAPGLTYGGTAYRFASVAQAQEDWGRDRDRVKRALDAIVSVGLVPGREGLLVFPKSFALKSAKERLDAVKTAFPDSEKRFLWKEMPEAARATIGRAARAQYDNLLVSGRGEVTAQLKRAGSGREETAAKWEEVRKWKPVELASWNELAMALLRLEREKPVSPTEALADFLERKTFSLKTRTVVVELPNSLKLPDEAALTVFHKDAKAMVFRTTGAGAKTEGGRSVRHSFRLDEGVEIVYRPGDALRAELPLSGGRVLSWTDARSLMWQFEKLSRLPNVEGRVADEVKLEWRGDDGLPVVPDLVPDPVKLE